MKPHVRNYLRYFNLGEQDIVTCEVCGKAGRLDKGGYDIHHIVYRSQGGGDEVENNMCLCRKCHSAAHGIGNTFLHPDVLREIHKKKIER